MPKPTRSIAQASLSILPYAAALALVAVLLSVRNSDLYPQVFSDEYAYSVGARLQPLARAGIPNYLFFALFGTTSACGDAFLDCARHLNLLLFIAGAPFIYLVGRRVASPHLSGIVTLLALAGPTNLYTAFFMPESSYWFVFWATTWLAVRAGERPQTMNWAIVGVAVGILALVKPHGLFVAPALAAFAALGIDGSLRKRSVAALLVVCGAMAIKLVGGFVLAGPAGLTLFGSSYGGMASTGLGGPHVAVTVAASARILAAHGCGLVLVFALPLGAGAVALASRRVPDDGPLRSLALLTVCLIATLAAMAAVFTATVAGQGPYENELRVHARYYSFAFPLLLMLAASQVGERPRMPLRVRLVAGAALALAIVVAVTVGLAGLDLHLIDGPEVFTAGAHAATRRLAGLFALLVVAAWCAKPRVGALAFLLLLTPWFAWRGNREALDLFSAHRTATIFERAGAAAHEVVPAGQRVRIATDDVGGAYRAMFQLDRPDASFITVAPGEAVPVTAVDEGQWLLVVPAHPVEGAAAVTRTFDGFVLLRR